MAENAEKMLENKVVKTAAKESYVHYEPLGPILQILPWNFPFWQAFRCALPALVVGNVCLLKGAPSTPQCSLAIEECFKEAGFENDEYQNLFAGIDQTEFVIGHKYVRGVNFVGSTRGG